jgi:hypothetical protein
VRGKTCFTLSICNVEQVAKVVRSSKDTTSDIQLACPLHTLSVKYRILQSRAVCGKFLAAVTPRFSIADEQRADPCGGEDAATLDPAMWDGIREFGSVVHYVGHRANWYSRCASDLLRSLRFTRTVAGGWGWRE